MLGQRGQHDHSELEKCEDPLNHNRTKLVKGETEFAVASANVVVSLVLRLSDVVGEQYVDYDMGDNEERT